MEQGRIRFWQGFSLALVIVLIAVATDSVGVLRAQSSQEQRFTEIDVERINVIEANGPASRRSGAGAHLRRD